MPDSPGSDNRCFFERRKAMKKIEVALVSGDGAAPEMMAVACDVVQEAARKDGIEIIFVDTPMGWVTYQSTGQTLPPESLERATALKLLFFGGVGDPEMDKTVGKQHPEQRPEARCLLTIRKEWELLLNFRPMIFHPELREFCNLAPRNLPEGTLQWHFVRYLLEDSYFGTRDLYESVLNPDAIGLHRTGTVTGDEEIVSELAYYSRRRLVDYFRAVFEYARKLGLPVIPVDKQNIMSRYDFWRAVMAQAQKDYGEGVRVHEPLFVDAANAIMIQNPQALHGVIVCGNEHGDILSDGGAAALGSMGLMCSSAVNPNTGAAMFESGAGTAPTLAGQDVANPLGRILTGAMLLDHIGAVKGAEAIRQAVRQVIQAGFRTRDIASGDTPANRVIGTEETGKRVISFLDT